MAEDGQVGRFAHEAEPSLADLLDPVALEARLKDARARRAEAIARRAAASEADPAARPTSDMPAAPASHHPDPPLWRPTQPAPHSPTAEETSPGLPAPRVRPVLLGGQAPGAPRRTEVPAAPAAIVVSGAAPAAPARAAPGVRRLPPAAILFLAGLGLGAAIVAAVVEFRPSTPAAPTSVATSAPTSVSPAVVPRQTPPATPAKPASTPATAAPTLPAAPVSPTLVLQEPRAAAEPVAVPHALPDLVLTAPAGLAAPAVEPVPQQSAPSPVTTAVSLPAPGPSALPARISIHYPGSAERQALAARDALLAAGVSDVETLKVGFAIGRSNVRYYHAEDREGAEGASALLASRLDGAPETRDFTNYPTPTAAGRIELWLAGEPVGGGSAPRQARSTPAAAPAERHVADPYSPSAPQDQVQAVQRILLDRLTGGNP